MLLIGVTIYTSVIKKKTEIWGIDLLEHKNRPNDQLGKSKRGLWINSNHGEGILKKSTKKIKSRDTSESPTSLKFGDNQPKWDRSATSANSKVQKTNSVEYRTLTQQIIKEAQFFTVKIIK